MAEVKKNKTKYPRLSDEPLTLEDVDIYIKQIVNNFVIENNIDDLSIVSANIFNACLMEIGQKIFKAHPEILHTTYRVNNAYDIDKVDKALNIYIHLSMLYDNPVTLVGFSHFSGIQLDTINAWKYDTAIRTEQRSNLYSDQVDKAQTKSASYIYHKIIEQEETSTLNTKKYNDLRIIARLNRITQGAYRDYQQVTAIDERRLSAVEIADKYQDSKALETDIPPLLPVDE